MGVSGRRVTLCQLRAASFEWSAPARGAAWLVGSSEIGNFLLFARGGTGNEVAPGVVVSDVTDNPKGTP
jgi:hypothetical protein